MLCFIGLQQNLTSVDDFETVTAVPTAHGEVPSILDEPGRNRQTF